MIPFARILSYGNKPPAAIPLTKYGTTVGTGFNIVPQQSSASCTDGVNSIYLHAGNTASGYNRDLVKYDILTNQYAYISTFPTYAYPRAIEYLNSSIYVLYNNTPSTAPQLSRYDISTGTMNPLSAIPGATSLSVGALINDGTNLYTLARNNNMYKYTVLTNTWTLLGNMGTYGDSKSIAYYDGFIYSIGQNTFKRISSSGGSASTLSFPSGASSLFAASLFEFNGDIYCSLYAKLWKYTISTNTWVLHADGSSTLPNIGQNGVTCCVPSLSRAFIFYYSATPGGLSTVIGTIT